MRTVKTLYFLSITFWIVFYLLFVLLGDDSSVANPYYLKNHEVYNSYFEFFNILSDLKPEYNLNVFTWCCDLINYIGDDYGYDYQTTNLIIFVIGIPLFILNIILIVIIQLFTLIKLNKKSK